VTSKGSIRAIDYQTGQIRWNHEINNGGGAGVLTTDSGVTFTGDGSGNASRCATSDGSTLWHAAIGGVSNSPITVESTDASTSSSAPAASCTPGKLPS